MVGEERGTKTTKLYEWNGSEIAGPAGLRDDGGVIVLMMEASPIRRGR
jgi:hypothetical protein